MATGGPASSTNPKLIQSLPPEVLKLIPAEQPPPGVIPNFADPASLFPTIVGVGSAFLAFALVCYSIRIYTNIKITKKWNWDDLTCTLGFLFAIVYYAAIILGCVKGSGGQHLYELHIDKVLNHPTLIQTYITTVIVTPALGLIKGSLFIQYFLIFRPVRYVRISVYIAGTLSAVVYIAITVAMFVLNSPWPGQTLLDVILSWRFAVSSRFSIPTGVIGVTTDWCLFFLPIPAVYSMHLTLAKKFAIMFVFMTGGLAAIASTVILYYRVRLQQNPLDAQWKCGYIFIWAQIELFAGVAAASMPSVKRLMRHYKIFPSKLGSSFKYRLATIRWGSTRTTETEAWKDGSEESKEPNGLFGLANLAKPQKKSDRLTISPLGDSAERSDSHIVLTQEVFVRGGQVGDLTLSRW